MLIIGTIWKTIDLVHAPRDRLLRILVTCLLLLAAGQILSFPEASSKVDAFTTAGAGKITFNAIHMSGLAALILFFASSMREPNTTHQRQLRANTALLIGVLIALLVAMIATPATLRDHTLSTPYMAEPAIACFYIIGNAYFVYAYLTSGFWALYCARMASWHLAFGLRTMTLGLFGLAITSVNRVVWVCLRIGEPGSHSTFNMVNWAMNDWALGIVLIGVCYSASVQLILHLRSVAHHRRMYRDLTPLWQVLSAAYPELVLNREPAISPWTRFRLRGTHVRFYRRLIECRDGLVRLSPYLMQVAPDADLARGPADQLARHINDALALKPATEDPHTALSAARIALPPGNDLSADARELIAISRAYAKGNREQSSDHR
ncbi:MULTISPECIES: MAB_1171c family putative transporter [unclassified Streptomyces]|uniref:MAB_1171c family putative transporter n=1 Tax=unclassified Streptomyces TaxID=2593676 RepID=UPI00081D3813|nr:MULTISPECIES: MAB_1171c family putative transporter [unclassified Streptomyces]MYZ37865.1 hypothetical protein [Streptomyces sp. SID4917]SCF94796.1 hypothetical protein GA0115259_105406 [Streptomyces sp. MnatMP-M17]